MKKIFVEVFLKLPRLSEVRTRLPVSRQNLDNSFYSAEQNEPDKTNIIGNFKRFFSKSMKKVT